MFLKLQVVTHNNLKSDLHFLLYILVISTANNSTYKNTKLWGNFTFLE